MGIIIRAGRPFHIAVSRGNFYVVVMVYKRLFSVFGVGLYRRKFTDRFHTFDFDYGARGYLSAGYNMDDAVRLTVGDRCGLLHRKTSLEYQAIKKQKNKFQ